MKSWKKKVVITHYSLLIGQSSRPIIRNIAENGSDIVLLCQLLPPQSSVQRSIIASRRTYIVIKRVTHFSPQLLICLYT